MRTSYFLTLLCCVLSFRVLAIQQVDSRPEPRCNPCVVLKKKTKGKINQVILGYDNTQNLEYHKFKISGRERLRAVERVIFLYNSNGLEVFSYIPTIDEQLTEKLQDLLTPDSAPIVEKESTKRRKSTRTDSPSKAASDSNRSILAESSAPVRGKAGNIGQADKATSSTSMIQNNVAGDRNKIIPNLGTSSTDTAVIRLYHMEITLDSANITKKRTNPARILGNVERVNRIESPTAEISAGQSNKLRYKDFSPTLPKELRSRYRVHRSPRFYIEFGGQIGVAHRDLQIVSPLPDRKLLEPRLKGEHPKFGTLIGLRLGYYFNDRSSIYSGYLYTHQQFRGLHNINWRTGLQLEGAPSGLESYRFDYWGREVGYSYMPYRKKNGLSVDLGLHFLWVSNRTSIHKFTFGPHASIGLKIRLGATTDLRIMPTIYYNIRALEKGDSEAEGQQFATRLFITGMKVAMVWTK